MAMVFWLCLPRGSEQAPGSVPVATARCCDPETVTADIVAEPPLSPEIARSEPGLPELTKTTDLEWRDLQRTGNDLVAEIIAAPHHTRFARLLRNATFNPRDDYVPAAMRERIEATVMAGVITTKGLFDEQREACRREWGRLHSEGATVAVDLASAGAMLQLQKLGPDPLFRVENGVTHGIGKDRMVEAMRAERKMRQAGADFCRELAAAFGAAGTLTPEEAAAIGARAHLRIDLAAGR